MHGLFLFSLPLNSLCCLSAIQLMKKSIFMQGFLEESLICLILVCKILLILLKESYVSFLSYKIQHAKVF